MIFFIETGTVASWVIFIGYKENRRGTFLLEAGFGPQVLSSSASVCLSVCVYQSLDCSHDNSSAVEARITKFRSEMQSTLVQVPMVWGMIDFDLQGQI